MTGTDPRFCVHVFWSLKDGIGTMKLETATLAEAKALLAEVMTKSTERLVEPGMLRARMFRQGPVHLWEITSAHAPAMWAKAHLLTVSCPPAWVRSVPT